MMIALLIVICVNFQYLYLVKHQRVAIILVVHEIHEIRYYCSASTVTQLFWRMGSFKEKVSILENFLFFCLNISNKISKALTLKVNKGR